MAETFDLSRLKRGTRLVVDRSWRILSVTGVRPVTETDSSTIGAMHARCSCGAAIIARRFKRAASPTVWKR